MMTNDEIWEDLQLGGLQICQAKNGYKFTSDAVILANFVQAKKDDIICEFGTGSGIISILVAYKQKPKHIYAFDIQESVLDRARKSIQKNNQENVISLICDDLSNVHNYLKKVDVIICNPPYYKLSASLVSQIEEIAISKNEIKTDLESIIKSASQLLNHGGKFYICINPQRMSECVFKLKKHHLEPKKMLFSYPNIKKEPSCVFFECTKNGKEELKILPPIITHNDKGDYVTIIQELFKKE